MENSIKLAYYRVNKINFAYNEKLNGETKFQLKPQFQCKMGKKDKLLLMNFGIKLVSSESAPTPFDLEVELFSTFSTDEYAPEDAKLQMRACLTQLMPVLRAVVAGITANCNIPAYLMPLIDVDNMVNSAKSEENKNFN